MTQKLYIIVNAFLFYVDRFVCNVNHSVILDLYHLTTFLRSYSLPHYPLYVSKVLFQVKVIFIQG